MRQLMFAALAALSAIALPGCASTTSALIARDDVMETARRVTADYAAAWNAGDMNRFGALYTSESRHVTLGGEFIRGRQAIVTSHRATRERYADNVRMVTRLEGARAITNDAIVSVMIVEYTNVANAPDGIQAARLTTTLVRDGSDWQIAQAHASAVN
ncbi:MAG TPA: SgcJ/EcaC family oxidoreductase [Vitreimonas sp.]|nr:SgcJ/EcaC family oxidoreductase [Vitreimonas sp.]